MSSLCNGNDKLKDFFAEYLKTETMQYVVDFIHMMDVIEDAFDLMDSPCVDDFVGLYDVAREECVRRCVGIANYNLLDV